MFRIGIDFDNTIARYDRVFREVAGAMGLIADAEAASKAGIKSQIVERPGGDLDWKRLQGQVYGRHMLRAEMFPGFCEFLHLSKSRGHEVFIVSHKSEFGHFDAEQVSLRGQALLWLQAGGLFDPHGLALRRQDVFFESTRDDKIRRIRELGCTHFVDDLNEVFEDPQFPVDVDKFLFRPVPGEPGTPGVRSATSWRELAQQVHGPWTDNDVLRVSRVKFRSLNIESTELVPGRGNSRVYRLSGPENIYALKVYPDRQHDSRPRLETEFSACQALRERAYPVVEALAADKELGWGLYRWITGSPISNPDEMFLDEAIEFVNHLHHDSRDMDTRGGFAPASEACLSGLEISAQIQGRLRNFTAVESRELAGFLDEEFLPCFTTVVQRAKTECGKLFESALPRTLQILNPSDFGSHNALRDADGRAVFMDFEYFGWDDPVKLVCDFYWHPGMGLASDQRKRWISTSLGIFREDASFARRLNSYLPLFGLRWCLILLNEFLRQRLTHRLHADPGKAHHVARICSEQLDKSRMLLAKIQEMTCDHGSAIQAS